MLICHEKKILFLEIPKTGSTAIGSALNNLLGKENTLHIIDRFDKKKYSNCYRHCTIREVYKEFPETKNYFTFCFVRNPWDIQVSQYFFNRDVLKYDLPSFDTWIQRNVLNQMKWIKNLDFFDFIGRFETLQGDFNFLCEKLNLSYYDLEHANPSLHDHYTSYYNYSTMNLVQRICREEIINFEYEFENYL